jgi:hypothetical protein
MINYLTERPSQNSRHPNFVRRKPSDGLDSGYSFRRHRILMSYLQVFDLIREIIVTI